MQAAPQCQQPKKQHKTAVRPPGHPAAKARDKQITARQFPIFRGSQEKQDTSAHPTLRWTRNL